MSINPSTAVSSVRSFMYDCKSIMSIYQCWHKNRKTVFVIEKLGSAIWRSLTHHKFSVSGHNAIRKFRRFLAIFEQVVRVGVGITSGFKCFFFIDFHTSWVILCTTGSPRRKVNEMFRKLSPVARKLQEIQGHRKRWMGFETAIA